MNILGYASLLALTMSGTVHAEPRRVLLVGDSQSVGTFGRVFAKTVRRRGAIEVAVVARCGATPLTFLESGHTNCGFYERARDGSTLGPASGHRDVDLLETWLQRERPRAVVIQLGGNLLHAAETHWEDQVTRTLAVLAANGRPECYWVGPPPGWARPQERFTRFYAFLARRLAGHCEVYDSRTVVTYPDGLGDGVHLDRITARELHDRLGCALDGSDVPRRPECLTGPQRANRWSLAVAKWAGAWFTRRTGPGRPNP